MTKPERIARLLTDIGHGDTLHWMSSAVRSFWKEENGQDLVEYSLLLAFIAIAAISILSGVGGSIKKLYTTVGNSLNTAASTAGS